MGFLAIVFLFIYTLACCVLIFVILIQSGDKGGGLSSLGSSSQGLSDALGATGAEKTLNKITTIAASLFIILAVVLSYMLSGTSSSSVIPDSNPAAPLSSASTGGPAAPAPVSGNGSSAPSRAEVTKTGNVNVTEPIEIPAAPAGEKLPANPVTAPASAAPAASSPAAEAPAKAPASK